MPAESADDLRPKLKQMREILYGLSRAHETETRCNYWSVSVEPALLREDRSEFRIRGRWLGLFCQPLRLPARQAKGEPAR